MELIQNSNFCLRPRQDMWGCSGIDIVLYLRSHHGQTVRCCGNTKFTKGFTFPDTDQSLLILMSFLHNGGRTPGIDVLDFAARLKHWTIYGFRPMDTWATDIGMTVDAVTNEPDFAIDPYEASTRYVVRNSRITVAAPHTWQSMGVSWTI